MVACARFAARRADDAVSRSITKRATLTSAYIEALQESRLPSRYSEPWRAAFSRLVAQAASPGAAILDVGSGDNPVLERALRPSGVHYVGLDVRQSAFTPGTESEFDQTCIADVSNQIPEE